MRAAALIIVIVLLALSLTMSVAIVRWREATARIRRNLTAIVEVPARQITREEIDQLPPPVARYLRLVLGVQPRPITNARIRWKGTFFLRGWKEFTADQFYSCLSPGFLWDARIQMAPGLPVFVRDSLVNGAGSMRGAVLALLTVVDVHDNPEISASALQRYLGEAVWFPSALLPRNGVSWTALTASSARASQSVDGITISLDFFFGPDGLVERIYAPSRFRDVSGTAVPTPWEATVSHYVERGGFRIPASGEAAWLLPEGRMAYWRGEVADLDYVH